MRKQVTKLMMMAALLGLGIAGAATHGNSSYTDAEVAKKLAHEIRMYSRYSIWDNINFRVNEGNVELLGQVNQPYKKADLTRLAQHVPGVASVNVTQLDVTVQYDAARLTEDDILRTLRANPEVRIKDDARAGH